MTECEKIIKQVYESKETLKSVHLPEGTTMGMVSEYIIQNYKDEKGRPIYYEWSECYEDEHMYYWDNGFSARIDIWSGEITIWKC